MKISYNWLKEYLPEALSPEEISVILTGTGLEVETLEPWSEVKGGLDGLVIGEVIGVMPHPNADKLKLTRVQIGPENVLSIVCGASNVAQGHKVVVAPIGTTVHPLKGEPFKISKSKIRGEWSEGMLCAEDEIGLGESHDGILVLPDDVKIGITARDYFKIEDDFVFEIGITPNRSDALSHRGVARDISAFLRKPSGGNIDVSKTQLPVNSTAGSGDSKLEFTIEVPADCVRFSGVVLENIQVIESPDWLIKWLTAIGIRPVNNVVDITNFICHDMGQPMHAYDFEKIAGRKIIVGKLAGGSTLKTLDGNERKLHAEDLLIKDHSGALGLAGVFGGLNSSINPLTTKIFLESACFSPVAVRKTARRHGLNTDASFRFERGTDAGITVAALEKAVELLVLYSGASVNGKIADLYPSPVQPAEVTLRREKLNTLIGQHIDSGDVLAILKGLEIAVLSHVNEDSAEEKWQIKIPLFKTDVKREADVIEEILRIYGYNNIKAPAQLRSSLPFRSKNDPEKIQTAISGWLASRGMNEIMTNSLSSSAFLNLPGPELESMAVRLLNPLSIDMDVMRQSMLYTGLKVVAFNHNRRLNNLRLFEFGKTYHVLDSEYAEQNVLAFYFSGTGIPEWWDGNLARPRKPIDGFFEMKGHVEALFSRLGIAVVEDQLGEELNSACQNRLQDDWLESSLTWKTKKDRQKNQPSLENQHIARIGKLNFSVLENFGINGDVWYAEVNWDEVLKYQNTTKLSTTVISRFPTVRRDLSLLVNESVSYQVLRSLALGARISILKEVSVFDVFRAEKLGSGIKSYGLSFLLESTDHTLTDKEIDENMDKLASIFSVQVAAEVRRS